VKLAIISGGDELPVARWSVSLSLFCYIIIVVVS